MADLKIVETEKNIEPDEPYVYILEIKHPLTKDSFEPPIIIYLYPPESEIYQNTLNKLTQQREIVEKQCLNSDNMGVILWDLLGAFLAECTYDWDIIDWEGETLFCYYDNAKMLFKALSWLRDQVVNYYTLISGERGNINYMLNRDQVANGYKLLSEQCENASFTMNIERDYGGRPHRPADPGEGYVQDALSALINLGYPKKVAKNALDAVHGQGAESLEDLVRQCLQWLSK